ncbi:Endoribonuclease L-PSP/chorismate mutase-like protein [Xylariales sp. PMI_506]|nr:Endoribonuclease L-PSP/chorismate mutase-like protein [Xylariales sp. PMI_506]
MLQRFSRALPIRPILFLTTRTLSVSYQKTVSIASSPQKRNMSDYQTVIAKDIVPPVGPYSHAVKTPTAIYCSGQIHLDPAGNLTQGTIAEKTALCFKNLEAVLKASGTSLNKIVKVNIFLADMSDFVEMNGEYEKWMTHKPARSCVAVKQLPKGADVEIECVALP